MVWKVQLLVILDVRIVQNVQNSKCFESFETLCRFPFQKLDGSAPNESLRTERLERLIYLDRRVIFV